MSSYDPTYGDGPQEPPREVELPAAMDDSRHEGGAITGRPRYYRHPQGAYVTVWPDGTLDARKPDGKKKKTSATAEKLRRGHGAWVEVSSLDDSTRLPSPLDIATEQAEAERAAGSHDS